MSHVLFASYGNDSIALIQWLAEHKLAPGIKSDEVTVAHSDTGWAAPWWKDRVAKGVEWVHAVGFKTAVIPSIGMEALVKLKQAWPRNGMQFCTEELKIVPARKWLNEHDPEGDATAVCGVRRCESPKRATWPEWKEESAAHGGRPLWSPLVAFSDEQRDALLGRAGWEVLPHRSQECYPCVNSARSDLVLVDEERLAMIERIETELGLSSTGKPRTMFRPNKFMGAVGIREIARWAHAPRGKFEPAGEAGCDSGMCEGVTMELPWN